MYVLEEVGEYQRIRSKAAIWDHKRPEVCESVTGAQLNYVDKSQEKVAEEDSRGAK